MNERAFFDAVRTKLFSGRLTFEQVEGLNRIVAEANRRDTSLKHLAYILATAFHETAHTMQPIREMGGERYLRSKRYYPWVGEGLVQVTWEENHRKFGATKPGQMLTWPIALRAIFDGMTKGMFTGKKLSDYIAGSRADYKGARRIVNGTDKAAMIAGYAVAFEHALTVAGYGEADPQTPTRTVDPSPEPESPHVTAGTGKAVAGATIIGAIAAALYGVWEWFGGFF